MSSNNTAPTPITDKNGKQTTVHKKTASGSGSSRSIPSVSSGKRLAEYDEVKDVVTDLINESEALHSNSSYNFKPQIVSVEKIIVRLIGHDPTIGVNTDTTYGGRGKNAVYGDHISVGSVTKILDQLVEDGELVKVKEPTYDEKRLGGGDKNVEYVSFPYRNKVGYITADVLADSKVKVTEEKNAKKVAKLRQTAAETVAARHADEVEEELARLREQAGI